MLILEIQPFEYYDEKNQEFVEVKKATKLVLEHSLVSISKWEMKYKKAYLSDRPMNEEEVLYYIKCMTISQNIDDSVYLGLSKDDIIKIKNYIEDDMTAVKFPDGISGQRQARRETYTSELIYYLMTANNIPVEFQKWHLNRLLTLLKVCAVKNTPPKRRSKSQLTKDYAAINRANRAKFHTKG